MNSTGRGLGVVTIAAALAAILTLTACATGEPAQGPRPGPASPDVETHVADAGATLSLSRNPRLSDIPQGTILATGTFMDRDAAADGTLEVRATGENGLEFRLVDLVFDEVAGATLEISSLDSDATTDELREAFSFYRYEEIHPGDQAYSVPAYDGFFTSDPSWMRTAVIWAPDAAGYKFGSPIGVATLTWDLPDMRPNLNVRDTGDSAGARGEVHLEVGVPVAYTVAWGDVRSAIADRFGIEVSDLNWLNPGRRGGEARADETLNLSRRERGKR